MNEFWDEIGGIVGQAIFALVLVLLFKLLFHFIGL